MTPHQHQAIREAIGALEFAARINHVPEYVAMYEHALEGLRLHCWCPAPGSLGDILIRTEMAETAPPTEEFLRNYAQHAAKT